MLFVDAIMVEVRDGQVTNRPVHAAIGVNGERDILALWAGGGAKFWLSVLTEIKNRGRGRRVHRGLRRAEGLPESITTGVAPRCGRASTST